MNRETALARMGGDEGLLKQLAEFFLADTPALLNELDEAVRKGDARGAHHAAHSLKGLAANFEAVPAISAAREVELLGKAGDAAGCQSLLPHLHGEFARLSTALASLLNGHQAN